MIFCVYHQFWSRTKYEIIILCDSSPFRNNHDYLKKVKMGKEIAAILDEEDIHEKSLSREHEEALQLYKKQKPCIDITSVKLHP